MFSTKFCAKRRFQICLKCLIVIMVIGIYFIILLRESIAALEVTNRQQNSLTEVVRRLIDLIKTFQLFIFFGYYF